MAESTIIPANRVRVHFEQQPEQRTDRINVGDMERWVSLLGGTALAAFGLARGSLGGLGLAALGGALAYRGATGHCPMYGTLGISTAERRGPATVIRAGHGVKVERSVTIDRSPEEASQPLVSGMKRISTAATRSIARLIADDTTKPWA